MTEHAAEYLFGALTMTMGILTGAYMLQQMIHALHVYGVPGMTYRTAFSLTVLFVFQLVAIAVAITGLVRMSELTKKKVRS
jgi:hypothetical protein